MQGGLRSHRPRRLRLQIRATQCQAPPGRSYWSDPVELDALGGAAVVTVPSPLLPPTAAIPAARAAYMMSGEAGQRSGTGAAAPSLRACGCPVQRAGVMCNRRRRRACQLPRPAPAPRLPARSDREPGGGQRGRAGAVPAAAVPAHQHAGRAYPVQAAGTLLAAGLLVAWSVQDVSSDWRACCLALQASTAHGCAAVPSLPHAPPGHPARAGAGGGRVARAALDRRAAPAAPVRARAGGGLAVERRLRAGYAWRPVHQDPVRRRAGRRPLGPTLLLPGPVAAAPLLLPGLLPGLPPPLLPLLLSSSPCPSTAALPLPPPPPTPVRKPQAPRPRRDDAGAGGRGDERRERRAARHAGPPPRRLRPLPHRQLLPGDAACAAVPVRSWERGVRP